MKQTLLFILLALLGIAPTMGQNALNAKADNIVGTYTGTKNDDRFKARITRQADGTYKAQVFWVENDRDEDGNKILDRKNPDKSLRSRKLLGVNILTSLTKNGKKWEGGKIYNPMNGKTYKCAIWLEGNTLKVRGYVGVFYETHTWTRE